MQSTLARHYAARYLERTGVEDDLGFVLRPGSNIALHLVGARYQIRILKVEKRIHAATGELVGTIPMPQTRARKEYFQQSPGLALLDGATRALPGMEPLVKLVALWETDVDFQLKRLDLVCTKGLTADGNVVDSYWRVPWGRDAAAAIGEIIDAPDPMLIADLELPAAQGEIAEGA